MQTNAEEIADKWSRRLAATHHQLMAMTAVARYGVDFCDTLIADGKSDEPAKHFKAKLETAVAMAERFDHNAPPPPAGVNAELLAALQSCVSQIEQMQGMFDDNDDDIREALDDAYAAIKNAAIAAAEAGQVEHDGIIEAEGAITAEDWKAALEEHRDKVERRKAAQPTQEHEIEECDRCGTFPAKTLPQKNGMKLCASCADDKEYFA